MAIKVYEQDLNFIKKGYLSVNDALNASTTTTGSIVFDSAHNVICVDGKVYGGSIQNVEWNESAKTLTITKADGTSQVLDFSKEQTLAGAYHVFDVLDSDTIQPLEIGNSIDGVTKITFKGIKEVNGVIEQGDGTTGVEFHDIAFTGKAEDVSVETLHYGSESGEDLESDNVQDALQEIVEKIVDNEKLTERAFEKVQESVGLTENFEYQPASTTGIIGTASSIKTALDNIDTHIVNLDGTATIATNNNGVVTLQTGVTQTRGEIANTSGTIELSKVATTGEAEDIHVKDEGGYFSSGDGDDLETIIQTIGKEIGAMVGGMRFNGALTIDGTAAYAGLNEKTGDVRPGDIYVAETACTIGEHSVEPGDMIVYKGTKSTSRVALDDSNAIIIERETDTMVTATGTLAANYVVLGGTGDKEVKTSTEITEQNLLDAIGWAKSAVQTLDKASGDGNDFAEINISTKTGTDGEWKYTLGVDLTKATINDKLETGTAGVLTTDNVANIKNYVDNSINELDSTVTTKETGSSADDNVHVEVVQEDGKLKSVSAKLTWAEWEETTTGSSNGN